MAVDYNNPVHRLYAEGFEAGINNTIELCRAWQAFRDWLNFGESS